MSGRDCNDFLSPTLPSGLSERLCEDVDLRPDRFKATISPSRPESFSGPLWLSGIVGSLRLMLPSWRRSMLAAGRMLRSGTPLSEPEPRRRSNKISDAGTPFTLQKRQTLSTHTKPKTTTKHTRTKRTLLGCGPRTSPPLGYCSSRLGKG